MPETRNDELYCALKHNGYPDDFCREIAYRQMNTDFTATRMLGYLYRVTSPRAEDVVDEMLAILSDRKAWIEKKQSEEAQACNLCGRLCRKSGRDRVNLLSVGEAQKIPWEQSIPKNAIYDKFRELAATVHRFEDQIFAYWDCPIAISNGYTECTNRLIRENNLRGRGYSFEVLRARTLYRKTNLRAMLENGLIDVGPVIPEDQPVFHFESAKEDEDEDLEDDYEPFPNPEEE